MVIQIVALPVTENYDELQGSPVETDAVMDFQATRVLRCAWADRLTLADQMLTGYLVNLGADCDGNVIVSRMGQLYPYRDGIFADTCHIEPFSTDISAVNGNGQFAGYSWAKVTVHYKPYSFDVITGNLLAEESVRVSTQVVHIPYAQLYWAGTPPVALNQGESPTKIIRVLEWSLSYRQLLVIPSCWLDATGNVNCDEVTSPQLNRTFAPESLLYHGPEITRVVGESGRQYWNVTLSFSHLLDPAGGSTGISWNYVQRGPNFGASFSGISPQAVYTAASITGPPTAPVITLSDEPYRQYTPIPFSTTFML